MFNKENYQARNIPNIFSLIVKIILLNSSIFFFNFTNLGAEPHSTTLHNTWICKFSTMSGHMALQPFQWTWLLAIHFTTHPKAAVFWAISRIRLHSHNMASLKNNENLGNKDNYIIRIYKIFKWRCSSKNFLSDGKGIIHYQGSVFSF